MKKSVLLWILIILLTAAVCSPALSEDDEAWKEKPVITHILEVSNGKLLVEWEGSSDLYQVYADGKNTATVNLPNTIIDVKDGTHQIAVVPVIFISKEGDRNFSFDLDVEGLSGASGLISKITGLSLPDFNVGFDIDLGALGFDPKDAVSGNPSDTVKINYTANSIANAVPEIVSVSYGFDERITLTFSDRYNANLYRVFIKNGKDVNFVDFDASSEEAAGLITKENTKVTITLDPQYLQDHECMYPEQDQKYSFSVKLQKWPVNYVDGTKETELFLESKESKAYDYTPAAAWKTAPVITYASQTADGQITLRWDHDDNGMGCEYRIMKRETILGVKTGEEPLGKASGREFVISDLINGKYSFTITPLYAGEEGFASDPASAEVKNSWAAAPSLKCKADHNQVTLQWKAAEGVESYHVTVYAAGGSLLKFVNMDYKQYEEFDVPAETGDMSYTYEYDQPVDEKNGTGLKFEIYGVRYAADGSEQRSETASQTVTVK